MKKEKQDEIFRQAYSSDLEENTKNVMEELGMEYVKKTYKVVNAEKEQTTDQLIENVKAWASERDIDKQSADAGYRKTIEELGELSSAYSRSNREMMMDSMGDATVCLINLATQMGLDFKECLAMAYDEISGRTGKMVNGVFVKDEDLKNKKDN